MATQTDFLKAMAPVERAAAATKPTWLQRAQTTWRALLRKPELKLSVSIVRDDMAAVARHLITGAPSSLRPAQRAATSLARRCGLEVVEPGDEPDDAALQLDEAQVDEALDRARRGQIDDALIHLGRALPASHADLAHILAQHIRSRT